jgi:hypothetical protein
MKCPHCGMINEEGSSFCSNCGTPLVEREIPKKKGKGKILAGVVIAVIVVASVGYFMFFGYETERANDLVEMANEEISKGNSILNTEVSPKFSEFREVDLDLDDEDEINQEIGHVSGWREDSEEMIDTVDEVIQHFESAKGFFEETEHLRLPEWYHEYIDLKVQAIEKDLERMEKMKMLLGNYGVYYGFCENYLNGELKLVDVMEDLDEGNSRLDSGRFGAASTMFESALEGLRESVDDFDAAGELIDLEYMDDLEEYVGHLDLALGWLKDATDFLGFGSLLQAAGLVEKADTELGFLGELSEDVLEEQLGLWYEQFVNGVYFEIEDLLEEVQRLEQQAAELYEENQ